MCIFEGIIDAPLYIQVLEQTLLPFLEEVYPDTHRFMADNDPKHTSKMMQKFLLDKRVNWWRTPAESPDCNPIENLWHELKEYQRREVKPKTKQELIDGIHAFWETVDVAKYIQHLCKVISSDRTSGSSNWLLIIQQFLFTLLSILLFLCSC